MHLSKNDFIWIAPLALLLGAGLSSLQPGNWLIGFASFSFLVLLAFVFFTITLRRANGGKTLATILAITLAVRLIIGVSLYVFLPIYGHEDADDKAGYVFTDAHRRDDQAWDLAVADRPIVTAFTDKFAYDQYGGLLAFSALIYRYLSPDAHRPLLLILISAIIAALGIPFLWMGVNQTFGEKVALATAWIFALYPESVLLGSAAMREPYLLTFSAMALYGFVYGVQKQTPETNASKLAESRILLAIALIGMLLVSPAVAVATLIVFAGWVFFTREQRAISWKTILLFIGIFFAGLFFLSASLNRSGEFNSSSPLSVVNDWLTLAVKWNAYGIERESGWVQKLFDEMPQWLRLPFVAGYGILQPVLPAAVIAPTVPIWWIIHIARALGWYVLLPAMILSFGAGAASSLSAKRNLIQWLALLSWTWVLLAALRAGGDQWDNPRYRTILFLWQAILGGVVWVWWRESRSAWFMRVIACELVFITVFTQWYASRYFHWGGQLPFPVMVGLIIGLWLLILVGDWVRNNHLKE